MKTLLPRILEAGVWLSLVGLPGDVLPLPPAAPPPPTAAFAAAPLRFEEAPALAPGRTAFLARGHGFRLRLTASTVEIALDSAHAAASAGAAAPMVVGLLDADARAELAGAEPAVSHVHYLLGSEPSQWRTHVPTFARVRASGVYPGVNLVYRGGSERLEYDFELEPGADPRQVRLGFRGVESLKIDAQGDLVVQTAVGEVRHRRPRSFQVKNGNSIAVASSFVVEPAPQAAPGKERPLWVVGFALGAYDPGLPLTIDPVLTLTTYWGGAGDDQAYGVATDSQGNVYVTGQTASGDFPGGPAGRKSAAGKADVFVTKFSPDGREVLYSTVVGGADNDRGFNVTVDRAGGAIVVGQTASKDFPTKNAFQPFFVGGTRDGLVFKLQPDGAGFVFSSYLGGTGDDDLTCVALDRGGNILAGGGSSSTNLPVIRPYQVANRGGFDAVLVKFDPAGVLKYCSYLGGSGPHDSAIGVATDNEGSAYLTGYTSSRDFPVTGALQADSAGGYDAFLTRFNPAGTALVYSTYLGGSREDVGRGIAVDNDHNVYVVGDTFSANFPTVKAPQPASGGQRDVFLCRVDPSGSSLVWSTYFGGAGDDLAGLALDPAGTIWLAGLTASTNLPLVNPIQSRFGGGSWDAFVARLTTEEGRLTFSTYVGGSGNDQGASIAIGSSNRVYVAGASASTDLPTIHARQSAYRGGPFDAFLLCLEEPPPPREVEPATPAPSVLLSNPPPAHVTLRQEASAPMERAVLAPVPVPAVTLREPAPPGMPQEPSARGVDTQNAAGAAATPTVPAPTVPAAERKSEPSPVLKTEATNAPSLTAVLPGTSEPRFRAATPEQPPSALEKKPPLDEGTPSAAPNEPRPEVTPSQPVPRVLERTAQEWIEDPNLAASPPPGGRVKPRRTAASEAGDSSRAARVEPAAATPPAASGETGASTHSPSGDLPALDPKWLDHPLLNTNLVLLGGAETVTPASSSYTITAPPGWAVTGGLTVLRYGTPGGFPGTNEVPGGGLNFFAGGPDSPVSVASQTVELGELGPALDTGRIVCEIAGVFGGAGGQKDNAMVEALFKDLAGRVLGRVATPLVQPAERNYRTGLLPRSASGPVPPQTRSVEVRLVMTRVVGDYNDAFADNLSLILKPGR